MSDDSFYECREVGGFEGGWKRSRQEANGGVGVGKERKAGNGLRYFGLTYLA